MKTQHSLEKGQILVLFVFGLIGLLAFTALAIDGGMVFTDRRYDQSVADAAALAGAQAAEKVFYDPDPINTADSSLMYEDFTCTPTDAKYPIVYNAMTEAITAAIGRANSNIPAGDTFPDTFDADLADHMGVKVDCVIQPADESPDGYEQRYLDIHVEVRSETRTSFAHMLFGRERIRNEVISVVRLKPFTSLAYGNAIVSLNQNTPCNGSANRGMEFDGGGSNDASIQITRGGIHSNSCITRNGHFSVDVTDGSVVHYAPLPGGYDDNGSGSISPSPLEAGGAITIDPIWNPTCGPAKSLADATVVGTTNVLPPGTYSSGIQIQNGDWVFEEGLYCLGGELRINGGNVTGGCTKEQYTGANPSSNPGPSGTCDSGGVTFFMKSGGVHIKGNAVVKLYAPLSQQAAPELKGMLIYMPKENSDSINIAGTQLSEFRGTILAPTGDISLTGTGNTKANFAVQVIGWNVTVGGNNLVTITNDADSTVLIPAAADQHQ